MESLPVLPSVAIKIKLNLKSLIPFSFSKNGLTFAIEKDLKPPNCFIKIDVTKGNVKDIKVADSYNSKSIIRKDKNNFVIQNIGEDQKYVNFVLCFEFVCQKWNHYVADLCVLVPFHTLPHLKFGDYFYDEFIFQQSQVQKSSKNMKFKACWIRSIDSKKMPVFKLYIEKKDGIFIKGADKDNMVLSIPDKPNSRTKHATKNLTFFFDCKVYPHLSTSYDFSPECFGCQNLSEFGMNFSSMYPNLYWPYAYYSTKEMPNAYPNTMNYNGMFPMHPRFPHTCFSTCNRTTEPQVKESETSKKTYSSDFTNVSTSQTIPDGSIGGENVPPAFHDIEKNVLPAFHDIGIKNILKPSKMFRQSSILSNSGQASVIDLMEETREMLYSLPFTSEFGVPFGGCKASNDSSSEDGSLQVHNPEYLVASEKDEFSLATSKTSTEAIPSSKPDDANELDLSNPILAKLFEFHDGKLTPISPLPTPQNVLKKLFPSTSLNSDLNKTTMNSSFEMTDPSILDCGYSFQSSFNESFKSTSSEPQSFSNP